MSNDPIAERVAEIRDIEAGLLIVCQNNSLELVDLQYIALRVQDLKEEIRILKARNL